MENLSKAIDIASGAFMFIIALSVSLYFYVTVDTYIDKAFADIDARARATSEENRVSEIDGSIIAATERDITEAEVIMSVMNINRYKIPIDVVNKSGALYQYALPTMNNSEYEQIGINGSRNEYIQNYPFSLYITKGYYTISYRKNVTTGEVEKIIYEWESER